MVLGLNVDTLYLKYQENLNIFEESHKPFLFFFLSSITMSQTMLFVTSTFAQ